LAAALIVLSHYQITPLLAARKAGQNAATLSPDLGLSIVEVALAPDGIAFPSGERLAWNAIERIASSENNCFRLTANGCEPIISFSEQTQRVYSLYPTPRAPTLLVAGFPMHRIKDTTPDEDTHHKIHALAPLAGRVLDTATGLGYTAIEAARLADHVVTIELDPAAQSIVRQNPWSQALFGNPRITQLIGDSAEVVPTLDAESFARILHDPPTFSLAGDLYSAEFYRELYRVLTPNGRLFHYIGNPESASGQRVTRGVIRRLQAAGFTRVRPAPQAFGVVAQKSSTD
jgi:hypothetical protein